MRQALFFVNMIPLSVLLMNVFDTARSHGYTEWHSLFIAVGVMAVPTIISVEWLLNAIGKRVAMQHLGQRLLDMGTELNQPPNPATQLNQGRYQGMVETIQILHNKGVLPNG